MPKKSEQEYLFELIDFINKFSVKVEGEYGWDKPQKMIFAATLGVLKYVLDEGSLEQKSIVVADWSKIIEESAILFDKAAFKVQNQ